MALYESLRGNYDVRMSPAAEPPAPADIEAVKRAALYVNDLYVGFFRMVAADGDLDRAAIRFHRELLHNAMEPPGRARSIAQVLQLNERLRPVADACLAISALREPVPGTSWTMLRRNDLEFVLRHVPVEYFRCALEFGFDPQAAPAAIDKVAAGEIEMTAAAPVWVELALLLFSAGFEPQAGYALGRAETSLVKLTDEDRVPRLQARIDTLRSWIGRAGGSFESARLPAGQVSIGLVGYEHPDRRLASQSAIDQIETLTVLGYLARYSGVQFAGSDDLVAVADQLRVGVPAQRRIDVESVQVNLAAVHRDLSEFAAVPEDTWLIVTSWFENPLLDVRFDAPLDPRVRPIFLSFRVEEPALERAGVIDYLKRHGPVGCADWESMQLLQAAGVPAFFSGMLVMTAGAAFSADGEPGGGEPAGNEVAWFDLAPEGRGRRRSVRWTAIRDRGFAENLRETAATLRTWQERIAKVITANLPLALAARSLGLEVDFRPKNTGDSALTDLGSLSDAEFDGLARGIEDKLAVVFGAVLAGQTSDEVYAAWREACAPDVVAAQARTDSVPELGALDFDLNEFCGRIREDAVIVERSEPAGAGTELNIEFSLDAKYKPQLDVVLDSVVANTDRPVRAFVLCRQHGPEDFERMARLFPTVSFVWLPTDHVDYGPIAGKVPWASLATMDRTLLPLILPDVDRMMHLDLDLLILGDLAELFDTPFEGRPLVAVHEPQMCFRSGYDTVRRTAQRLRQLGTPDLAVELMSRVVARHPFDFSVFNAGVMMMNLDRMRADDFCFRFLPYVQRYGVNGQEVLNIYVGDDYVRVGTQWNRNARLEPLDDTVIAHWAGPFKPWRSDWYVSGRELWQTAEARFRARTAKLDDEVSA